VGRRRLRSPTTFLGVHTAVARRRVSDGSGSCRSPSFVGQVAGAQCRADHARVLTNARAGEIHTLVTDATADPEELERIAARGVDVHVVPA